jgi:hypothetical protein
MGANEPRVNSELLERVMQARLDIPDYDKPWEVLEDWNLKQLGKQCEAFTEAEFAAVVLVAIRNYPQVVLKVILDELEGKNP